MQGARGGDRDRDGEEPAGEGGVVPARAPGDALLRLRGDRGQVPQARQGPFLRLSVACFLVWLGDSVGVIGADLI